MSALERSFLASLAVLLGLILVVLGAGNIYLDLARLHSPLDEVNTDQGDLPPFTNSGMRQAIVRGESRPDFLPVLAPGEERRRAAAPEVEGGQIRSALASPPFQGTEAEQALKKKIQGGDDYFSPVGNPERLVIEALGVDTIVVPVAPREVEFLGETYQQWRAPNSQALGWHHASARLGVPGNTVINGHSSGYGESFRNLKELENGDLIHVYSGQLKFTYAVANTLVLKERWEPIEVRMENARWIGPSRDERLTLVSCWPYNSNTHRVVVVARPVGMTVEQQQQEDSLFSSLPEDQIGP